MMNRKVLLPLLGQPDPYQPKSVHLVGRYALGVDWADGHGSIFPFDGLRRGCPCGDCAGLETLTPAMTWPEEIKREANGLVIRWSDKHESVYSYADLRGACRCATCTGGH
jgi:DUF971 family protein